MIPLTTYSFTGERPLTSTTPNTTTNVNAHIGKHVQVSSYTTERNHNVASWYIHLRVHLVSFFFES